VHVISFFDKCHQGRWWAECCRVGKKIPTSEEVGICFQASTRVFKPSREGSHRQNGVGVNESQAGLLTCSEGGLSILPHDEWIDRLVMYAAYSCGAVPDLHGIPYSLPRWEAPVLEKI
jgi:hypothetical protein